MAAEPAPGPFGDTEMDLDLSVRCRRIVERNLRYMEEIIANPEAGDSARVQALTAVCKLGGLLDTVDAVAVVEFHGEAIGPVESPPASIPVLGAE